MKTKLVFFIVGTLVTLTGWCASSKPTNPVPCTKGLCNEIAFTINLPDWDLVGFNYHVTSWLSEDGKRGCYIMIDTDHKALFHGANVMSYTAELADGAIFGVGLQYARYEILCTKGRISYKDVTKYPPGAAKKK